MHISDWKIGTKLATSFCFIALLIIAVGLLNYRGMNQMQAKTSDILIASPWVDAAMEMKLSVVTDMQLVMELQAAKNQSELDKIWAEHETVTAQEINELASASVAIAKEAGSLLQQMVPNISKTANLVQQITAASEEQSSSVQQIHQAMNQLETTTQQNASASEQLAATSEQLSGQAESFLNAVAFFKLRQQSSLGIR